MFVYLFICKIPTVLKFGMTNELNPMKRLSIYSGLNRVDKIICLCSTNDDSFEQKFKSLIDKHKDYIRDFGLGREWITIPENAKCDYINDYKNIANIFFKILKDNI